MRSKGSVINRPVAGEVVLDSRGRLEVIDVDARREVILMILAVGISSVLTCDGLCSG